MAGAPILQRKPAPAARPPVTAPDGRGLFQTRPSIPIRRGGEVVQVTDTKWTGIAARIGDPK